MTKLEQQHLAVQVPFKSRYENYIGGKWVKPTAGKYFENITPITGKPFCEIPRSDEADIEKALDAAHAAAPGWAKTTAAERAVILNKIADRIEENLESIAVAESWHAAATRPAYPRTSTSVLSAATMLFKATSASS